MSGSRNSSIVCCARTSPRSKNGSTSNRTLCERAWYTKPRNIPIAVLQRKSYPAQICRAGMSARLPAAHSAKFSHQGSAGSPAGVPALQQHDEKTKYTYCGSPEEIAALRETGGGPTARVSDCGRSPSRQGSPSRPRRDPGQRLSGGRQRESPHRREQHPPVWLPVPGRRWQRRPAVHRG